MRIPSVTLCVLLCTFISSCNKDDIIVDNGTLKPIIILDNVSGVYNVKVGKELSISPTYRNADDALFSWTIDGKLVSNQKAFSHTWEEAGDVFITLRVDNENGYAAEELKVEVKDLLPPAINLFIPSKGLKVQKGHDLLLAPEIANQDIGDFKIEWLRNGIVVSDKLTYIFNEENLGSYPITIRASNEDGLTEEELEIEVVENMPYSVSFQKPYYNAKETTKFTFAGRSVFLKPQLEYFDNPAFQWAVNGKAVEGATEPLLIFTPEKDGEYLISVVVTEEENGISVESKIRVVCEPGAQSSRYRAANTSSSAYSTNVFEFLPAPGQFVNETNSGGFKGDEITFNAANQYAAERLANKKYVSLGSFGGYVIVGFDHSIPNKGGYDFAIQGNAFLSDQGGSNEPGIVWVMQDVNGNGLPDDEWYELKGSETGNGSTIQDYEVTYYRPASAHSNVYWTDNLGNSGSVDYNSYHQQSSYYPLWMNQESYTLTGTRLLPKNIQIPSSGFWNNQAYEWGYVDNIGSDCIGGYSYDGTGQMNGFKISNAIFKDGTPVKLEYIDFIKVQCGVLAKSGPLGEISTEVFSFQDLNIK